MPQYTISDSNDFPNNTNSLCVRNKCNRADDGPQLLTELSLPELVAAGQ